MKPTHQAFFTTNFFIVILLVAVLCISACARRKKNVELYYQRATQLADEHNFSKALEYANYAVILQPSSRSLALKATLLYQQGKLQQSKKTFELALQHNAISPLTQTNILNNYAVVLVRLGYTKRAQAIWQGLINNKSYPTPEVAWFNLGLLSWQESKRLQRKNPQRALLAARAALQLFSKAISLEPAYVDAYFFRAQILVAYKKKKEAVVALKKVLTLAPSHEPARKMLRTLV